MKKIFGWLARLLGTLSSFFERLAAPACPGPVGLPGTEVPPGASPDAKARIKDLLAKDGLTKDEASELSLLSSAFGDVIVLDSPGNKESL
jgi:hypothetical protein